MYRCNDYEVCSVLLLDQKQDTAVVQREGSILLLFVCNSQVGLVAFCNTPAMKFENKAGVVFTVPLVIGVVLTYFGFQVVIAFSFGFVIFLWINGLHYLKLAYRTIPRDMR